MSIYVCEVCKKAYDITDDGDPFGRINGICQQCFDEKLDEEQHAFEDSKKKPSPPGWDQSGEGNRD